MKATRSLSLGTRVAILASAVGLAAFSPPAAFYQVNLLDPEGSFGGRIEPVEAVVPTYTELAWKARVEGVVRLEVEVAAEGAVTSLRVLRGLPLGLEERVVEAVSQWRFPAASSDRRAGIEVEFIHGFNPSKRERASLPGIRSWLARVGGLDEWLDASDCFGLDELDVASREIARGVPDSAAIFEEWSGSTRLAGLVSRVRVAESRGEPIEEMLLAMLARASRCGRCWAGSQLEYLLGEGARKASGGESRRLRLAVRAGQSPLHLGEARVSGDFAWGLLEEPVHSPHVARPVLPHVSFATFGSTSFGYGPELLLTCGSTRRRYTGYFHRSGGTWVLACSVDTAASW